MWVGCAVTGEEVGAGSPQYVKAEQGLLCHRAADEAAVEHIPDVADPVTREVVEEAVAGLLGPATTVEAAAGALGLPP